MKCDGYSWEEIERHLDLNIRVNGHIIQQVVDDQCDFDWTYTIGITESWDHPEFLCVDLDLENQHRLVATIVEDLFEHQCVLPDTLSRLDAELVAVHEDHFECGLVGGWERRYNRSPVLGDFLQVLPGPSWPRPAHACLARLDDPGIRLPDRTIPNE